MAQMQVELGEDYPLSGSVTAFEAYMFVTVEKWVSQHEDVENGIVVLGKEGAVPEEDWSDLAVRKKMLKTFNTALKPLMPKFPNPSRLSCCLIELGPNDATIEDVRKTVSEIQSVFRDWCIQNNRVGACVPHLWQRKGDGMRTYHLHVLYFRLRGQHNEFQTYLTE